MKADVTFCFHSWSQSWLTWDYFLYPNVSVYLNESYWAVLSRGSVYIMLCKVVLTFKSVDETLVCDNSTESYWTVLSCGTVYYSVQGGAILNFCGWNPRVWPSNESSWAGLSCSAVNYAVEGSLTLVSDHSQAPEQCFHVTIQMKAYILYKMHSSNF